nr:accessory Sec system glycosyltransferase Asp1 [Fructobacillus papyriferae]
MVSQQENQVKTIIQQLKAVADPFLVLPSYLPKWRTVARSLDLEALPYWSAFDALQRVQKKTQHPMQLADLTWPKDAQFVRMFDRVVVLSNMRQYANVFFAYPNADQIDRIDLLEKGKLVQQLTIDDRGFVSRVLDYEDGRLKKQSYLSEAGAVVAEQDYLTGRVKALLPDGQEKNYPQIDDLILDVTVAYLKAKAPQKAFIADSYLNRQLAERVDLAKLFLWTGQAPVQGLYADWTSLAKEVTLLQSQRPATRIKKQEKEKTAGIPTAFFEELIAPYPVFFRAPLKRKRETILYYQLGDLGQDDQETILKQSLDFVLEDDNRTVIFEGTSVPMTLPAVLDRLIDGQKGDVTDEQLLQLKAHFVFLPGQNLDYRLQYLQTASLFIDCSLQPDLAALAETVALGLPSITAVQTAYSVQEPTGQKTVAQLPEQIADLLLADNWQKQHEMVLEKAKNLQEANLLAVYQRLLQD